MTDVVKLVDRTHQASSQDVATMLERELAMLRDGTTPEKYGQHAVLLQAEMDGGRIKSLRWAQAGTCADISMHICNKAALLFAALDAGRDR